MDAKRELNKADWKKVEANRNKSFRYLVQNFDESNIPDPTPDADKAYQEYLLSKEFQNSYEFPNNYAEIDLDSNWDQDADLDEQHDGDWTDAKRFEGKIHPFPEWMQSDEFLDELRARVPVSQVVSRKVQLKKRPNGRELVGLSPFKSERTPSFFVNDNKGWWFDFSSGLTGDIFEFTQKIEGCTFIVSILKVMKEAGYTIPEKDEEYGKYLERQEKIRRNRKKK